MPDLGNPGEFPFTRGIQPTMYRGRLWTMRQYAGFGTAAESNARYRYLLEQGVSGLSVAFDLPTQMGYDSDHPLAGGEVGKVGVAIDSIDDMATLFDGIPLDRVSTSMTINSTAVILLALYVAVARKQGVPPAKLSGTIQNDILKEYVARGTYIYPPRASLRIVTDIFAYCERELPQWNTISISGYHIREAGSTAVQEVAFTFAHAMAYVQAAIDAGLDVNAFGQRLSFFFNAHNNFLEEIAKFRAARRLWARIMRDRFGATNPKAQQLRFHTQTAGSTLTAQQPDNNIVRVSLQALAAVLGGTQSLHCNGRDEALSLPTEESARIALRTQQIIASETGVANTVDPVGGSYVIEALTDSIEQGAEALLETIAGMGGTLAAIEAGFIQRQIQESAYRAQVAIDSGEAVVVGVNRFVEGRGDPDGYRPRSTCRSSRSIPKSSGGRWNGSARCARRGMPRRGARRSRPFRPAAAATRQPGAGRDRGRRGARHGRRDLGRHACGLRRARRNGHPLMLLEVSRLTTVFDLPGGPVAAVDDVSFEVGPGETLCLVGESGSGKSVTALSILRLVQPPGRIAGGSVRFKGRELLTLAESDMRQVRGAEISLIFQEPMTALNPVFTIGDQIGEALLVHGRATRREARARAVELLTAVRIPDAAARVDDYPHQLSGGQRQRVLIAMALACKPSLVIADEPTTALDVTIQAEILDLLREMKTALGLSLLLITHDLGVVAETADRVAVMYAGRIVEVGSGAVDLRQPSASVHPRPAGVDARRIARPAEGHRRHRADARSAPAWVRLQPTMPRSLRARARLPRRPSTSSAAAPLQAAHTARCYLLDHAAR